MKKTVFSVMAVLITVFLFFGVNVSAKEVKNICVYGDSIPAGYGLASPSENFVNQLAEEYSLKEGESLFNYAVSGATSGEILGQIKNTSNEILQNADTVIISAGGNDIMNEYGIKLVESAQKYGLEIGSAGIVFDYQNPVNMIGQMLSMLINSDKADIILNIFDDCMTESAKADYQKAVDDFEKNIQEMTEYIKNTGSQADIYIFALYDPISVFSMDRDFFKSLSGSIESMHEYVLKFAESDEKLHAVDAYSHFSGHYGEWTNIYKFDIHPNKAGHEQLFEITDKAVKADEVKESFSESSTDIYEMSYKIEKPENNDYIVWLILGGIAGIAVIGAVIIAIAKNTE